MITVDVASSLEELEGIAARAHDMSGAIGPVGDTVRGFFGQVFRTEGGRVGGWEPLSRGYLQIRKSRPMGVQSGGLLRSLVDPRARWHIATATKDRFDVGSRAPHAQLFVRGRGGQPARAVDRPDNRLADEVSDSLLGWLMGDAGASRGI